jgi:hypothetical protein
MSFRLLVVVEHSMVETLQAAEVPPFFYSDIPYDSFTRKNHLSDTIGCSFPSCSFPFPQISSRVIDAIISGDMRSLKQLRPLAPKVLKWLKESLLLAHKDDDRKTKIKQILGAPRFTPNLAHLGLWDDLIHFCEDQALGLGHEMQKCFVENDLGTVLGEAAVPNVSGKFRVGENGLLEVAPCIASEGVRRQDGTMLIPFPQNKAHSQLWNEQCYIHYIRMLAMGIDTSYQKVVGEVCSRSKGVFKSCTIKGYVRMLNKCLSRDDHYGEE